MNKQIIDIFSELSRRGGGVRLLRCKLGEWAESYIKSLTAAFALSILYRGAFVLMKGFVRVVKQSRCYDLIIRVVCTDRIRRM